MLGHCVGREFHLTTEELKWYRCQFKTYFRMLAGQFETLLQMLTPNLRRQAQFSNNLTSLTDWGYFAKCCLYGNLCIVCHIKLGAERHNELDIVVVGDVSARNHRDWLMCLLEAQKFGKNLFQSQKMNAFSAA